jgi:hypothetical protein
LALLVASSKAVRQPICQSRRHAGLIHPQASSSRVESVGTARNNRLAASPPPPHNVRSCFGCCPRASSVPDSPDTCTHDLPPVPNAVPPWPPLASRPPKQLFGSRINLFLRPNRSNRSSQQPGYRFFHLLLKFFLSPPTTALPS